MLFPFFLLADQQGGGGAPLNYASGKRPMGKENEHRYKVERNMRKVNTEKLEEDAAVVSWKEVESKDDVVVAYDLFEKKLTCLLDKHALLYVKAELRKKSPHWISNEILILIKLRQINEQKKKAKRSGDSAWPMKVV